MTALQQQAIDILCRFPEENLTEIISILKKMVANKGIETVSNISAIEAFHELEKMSSEIASKLLSDFDAEKEIEQARLEKYDSFN